MNELEARIIIICRKTKSVKEIVRELYDRGIERSYNHICNSCSNLSMKGLLIKKTLKKGDIRGNPSYYTATSQAIAKALEWIDNRIAEAKLERSVSSNIATLVRYTSRP